MSPDDPRHGTPAGYSAHIRAKQDACPSCVSAQLARDRAWRQRRELVEAPPADEMAERDRYLLQKGTLP